MLNLTKDLCVQDLIEIVQLIPSEKWKFAPHEKYTLSTTIRNPADAYLISLYYEMHNGIIKTITISAHDLNRGSIFSTEIRYKIFNRKNNKFFYKLVEIFSRKDAEDNQTRATLKLIKETIIENQDEQEA